MGIWGDSHCDAVCFTGSSVLARNCEVERSTSQDLIFDKYTGISEYYDMDIQ